MIKNVEILIEDNSEHSYKRWAGFYLISVNLKHKITEITGLNIKKLVIIIANGKIDESNIEWQSDLDIRFRLYIDFQQVNGFNSNEEIAKGYDFVLESLLIVWDAKKWPKELLLNFFDKIKREKYLVKPLIGKKIQSQDKTMYVNFICKYGIKFSEIGIQVTTRKTKFVKEIYFFKTHSDPSLFFTLFTKLFWVNSKHVIFSGLNEEINFRFDVLSEGYVIEFNPVYNDVNILKSYLETLNFQSSNFQMMKIAGL